MEIFSVIASYFSYLSFLSSPQQPCTVPYMCSRVRKRSLSTLEVWSPLGAAAMGVWRVPTKYLALLGPKQG